MSTSPMWGIIFKPWDAKPVYHRRGSTPRATACGRRIGFHTPWLPMKHVVKFGRPCRGCFAG